MSKKLTINAIGGRASFGPVTQGDNNRIGVAEPEGGYSDAVSTWREKRDYLLHELAKASGSQEKFKLIKEIEEVQGQLAKLDRD